MQTTEWLDENCGIKGWSIAPAGTPGIYNDAVAIYGPHADVRCGLRRSLARPGRSAGFYELRQDEPVKRIPLPPH
jgi:hypothetical protein